MKPICKSEASYLHWKAWFECLSGKHDKFTKWSKKKMVRSRRRYNKKIIKDFHLVTR